MKKHALDLVVGHFVKVTKTFGEAPDLRRTNNPALLNNLVAVTLRSDVPLGTIRLSECMSE